MTKRPLAAYDAKRDFARTPEPAGAAPRRTRARRRVFVVQMHRASHLHFDFRLELDGVLVSWAVPKGPSLDPHVRRLAMHVEDHPYDYRDFEGVIPEGNYGAGETIVWDRGTWRPLGEDPAAAIAGGELKFALAGEKLRGGFVLVRLHPRGGDDDRSWLLIKERDDAADPTWRIEDRLASVKSGRTLADLAKARAPATWNADRPASAKPARRRRPVKRDPLPSAPAPMLATLVDAAFDDPDWIFELKWDGYRGIATIAEDGTVDLRSRNGVDLLPRFPELGELAAVVRERPTILDGEIAALDAAGKPSFSALQHRVDRRGRSRKGSAAPVTFVAFDVLYADGRDLRGAPLRERKERLRALLIDGGVALFGKHVERDGRELDALAREQGLEGIVAKRADSAYVAGRSRDWLKIKTRPRQECVVGGWTEGAGRRAALGALVLGLYEDGRLVPVGSVGSGLDARETTRLRARLDALARATSPFARKPVVLGGPLHYVRPELVVEVAFAEWTADGALRQASYLGLREDKAPRACVRERPAPAASAH